MSTTITEATKKVYKSNLKKNSLSLMSTISTSHTAVFALVFLTHSTSHTYESSYIIRPNENPLLVDPMILSSFIASYRLDIPSYNSLAVEEQTQFSEEIKKFTEKLDDLVDMLSLLSTKHEMSIALYAIKLLQNETAKIRLSYIAESGNQLSRVSTFDTSRFISNKISTSISITPSKRVHIDLPSDIADQILSQTISELPGDPKVIEFQSEITRLRFELDEKDRTITDQTTLLKEMEELISKQSEEKRELEKKLESSKRSTFLHSVVSTAVPSVSPIVPNESIQLTLGTDSFTSEIEQFRSHLRDIQIYITDILPETQVNFFAMLLCNHYDIIFVPSTVSCLLYRDLHSFLENHGQNFKLSLLSGRKIVLLIHLSEFYSSEEVVGHFVIITIEFLLSIPQIKVYDSHNMTFICNYIVPPIESVLKFLKISDHDLCYVEQILCYYPDKDDETSDGFFALVNLNIILKRDEMKYSLLTHSDLNKHFQRTPWKKILKDLNVSIKLVRK
ncbi:hypothetical protein RCL1_005288 [Eukaryota sp. TZLM3-RCL]